jgi:SNF2 family DNA or RNA helicase
LKSLPVVTIENLDDLEFVIRTPYNETVVKLIRGIPEAWWNKKEQRWQCPLAQLVPMVKALSNVPLNFNGITMPKEAAPEKPPANLALLEGYQYREDKQPPFEHQKAMMALAIEKRTFAILGEMGTGKTRAMIDALSWLIKHQFISGVILVVPKCVLYNWQREIAAWSPLPAEKRVTAVLTGSSHNKARILQHYWHTAQFFITNYATMQGEVGDLLCKLAQSRAMAALLDESTAIKNHASVTAKGTHKLGLYCQFRYILTGTPITQGPLDAFSQFKFLSPDILGHHNFYSFKAEYAITGGFKGKEIVGYKNLPRLSQRILPWSYRILKAECLDLPPKMYQVVEVDATDDQRALYRQMRDESLVELDGKFAPAPVILTKLLRLQQITSGFLPLYDDTGREVDIREVECAKHEAAEQLVETAVGSNQKVIVWCRFTYDIKKMREKLERFGVVEYHGKVSDVDRQKAIDAFQTDASVRVFLGQIQTGGMGITLTAASTEIYISNTYTLADRLQSEDRAHRIGQKKTVTIIDVVTRKTVDEFILKALNDKKDIADVITGDNMREMAGDA